MLSSPQQIAAVYREEPELVELAVDIVLNGWGLNQEDISEEQLACALLMEATDQDGYVARGTSDASWPIRLRKFAYKILTTLHPIPS